MTPLLSYEASSKNYGASLVMPSVQHDILRSGEWKSHKKVEGKVTKI
jgi:hypothetical protein